MAQQTVNPTAYDANTGQRRRVVASCREMSLSRRNVSLAAAARSASLGSIIMLPLSAERASPFFKATPAMATKVTGVPHAEKMLNKSSVSSKARQSVRDMSWVLQGPEFLSCFC